MIFRNTIETTAKAHLDAVLTAVPTALSYVYRPIWWDHWVTLCTHRCNQLDTAGLVRSQKALHRFIEDAARAFARRILEGTEWAAIAKNDTPDKLIEKKREIMGEPERDRGTATAD